MTFQIGNSTGYKHGHAFPGSKTPEYICWQDIKQRCFNHKHKYFSYYGGRGITMASEWMDDFTAFLNHMGPRPTPKHTIDRIDNDLGYQPGNVRWATRKEQVDNRRNTRKLVVNGISMSVADAAVALGVPRKRLVGRMERGWPPEKIVAHPDSYKRGPRL